MVICPDCGKEVREAKFCSNCGSLLPKAEEVEDEVVDVPVEEKLDEEIIEVVPQVTETSEEMNDSNEKVEDAIEANIVKKSKFCSECGTEVGLETVFCPQCGFKLVREEKPQTKFCQSCGKKINVNAEICPHCGVRVANITTSQEKSSLLAAILSFLFPGLGHIYLGLTKKGVSFIIAYVVSAILIIFFIGIVLVIVVWLWALIDSIKSTDAINRGEFVEDKLF